MIMKDLKNVIYEALSWGIGLLLLFIVINPFSQGQVKAEEETMPIPQQIEESYHQAELDFLYEHYGWTLEKEYKLLDFIQHWQNSMGQTYDYVSFEYPEDFMGLSVTDYVLENSRMNGSGVNLYFRDQVYHHNSPNEHFQVFAIYLSDDPHLYFMGVGGDFMNEPTVMYANTELNEMGHVIFTPTQNVDLANAFKYIYNDDIFSYNTLLEVYK